MVLFESRDLRCWIQHVEGDRSACDSSVHASLFKVGALLWTGESLGESEHLETRSGVKELKGLCIDLLLAVSRLFRAI